MNRASIRQEQLRPEAVWGFYSTQRSAVLLKKQSALQACRGALDAPSDPRFTGWTLPEIEEHFATVLDEVDHQISLSLLAAAEAVIRVDFFSRVYRKRKDAVSRQFRDLCLSETRHADSNLRVGFNDILSVWAFESPSCRSALARFRGALNYRHWLAHGRFWAPKLGMRYSPHIVQKIIEELLEALALA